jgi:hypothetical protein
MQEEHDVMRTRINELSHHPDMLNGQAAYKKQICQWEAQWEEAWGAMNNILTC